jgi:hypothetical protein
MVPFTVLKTPKIEEGPTEVVGEFADEAEAYEFVRECQRNDGDHEFTVEIPPSRTIDPETPPPSSRKYYPTSIRCDQSLLLPWRSLPLLKG